MAYSLDDKITGYLRDCGIEGAKVVECTITIPMPNGFELHRLVTGVVTKEKLAALAAEIKTAMENAA